MLLHDVQDFAPIFVKFEGKLVGMVDYSRSDAWFINEGPKAHIMGGFAHRARLIERGIKKGYEFFVED